MPTDNVQKIIEDINNSVYYEKLGPIRQKLRDWLQFKNRMIKQIIIDQGNKVIEEVIKQCNDIERFSSNFAQLLNLITNFYGKNILDPLLKKKKSGIKNKSVFIDETFSFQKSKQLLVSKHQSIQKMSNFANVIHSGIKRISLQNQRIMWDFMVHQKKVKKSNDFLDSEYSKKFQIAQIKHNNKQYKIQKIQQAKGILTSQINHYYQIMDKLYQLQQKVKNIHQSAIQYFQSNSIILNQLISICFADFGTDLKGSVFQFTQEFKRTKNQRLKTNLAQKQIRESFKQIFFNKLQQINNGALQQISVASYGICIYTGEEKIQTKMKGIITLDGKFLIAQDGPEAKTVFHQMNLNEISWRNGNNEDQIYIKSKKKGGSNSEISIIFKKIQNKGEFILHIKKSQGDIQ